MEKLNVGLLAHVDAGKTTLTEQLCFHAGALRRAGSVDQGTAQSDFLPVERQRGISVRASTLILETERAEIHLIDTPGHVDFAAEVERAISVLDAAVLIISAAEGIQAQTELLYEALRAQEIPILFSSTSSTAQGATADAPSKKSAANGEPGCSRCVPAAAKEAAAAAFSRAPLPKTSCSKRLPFRMMPCLKNTSPGVRPKKTGSGKACAASWRRARSAPCFWAAPCWARG